MLQAIHKNKSSLYKRYLLRGRRRGQEGRVTAEDEIVSTIMGPLEFMSVEDCWTILRQFARLDISERPSGCEIQFWPSRSALGTSRIEPDMLVTFQWPGARVQHVLFEFKWASPLSGDHQLQNQWIKFLTAEERHNACHVFIGLDAYLAEEAKYRHDVWKDCGHENRLIASSWKEFVGQLKDLRGRVDASKQVRIWTVYVKDLLCRLGVREFGGFTHLAIDIPGLTEDATVLYSFSKFHGFEHLGVQGIPGFCHDRPLFWGVGKLASKP